jgi:hypothetical protein
VSLRICVYVLCGTTVRVDDLESEFACTCLGPDGTGLRTPFWRLPEFGRPYIWSGWFVYKLGYHDSVTSHHW